MLYMSQIATFSHADLSYTADSKSPLHAEGMAFSMLVQAQCIVQELSLKMCTYTPAGFKELGLFKWLDIQIGR